MRPPGALLVLLVLGPALAGAARSVRGRTLTSPEWPRVELTAEQGFRYEGRVPFRLDESEGERHVFVDADEAKTLRRLLIVQFEGFLPSSSEIFRYDLTSGREMAGLRFVSNTFAFPGAQEKVATPKNEADHTNNFLLAHGFKMPSVWLTARHLTVADGDRRKREMIVFYMEARSDLTMDDLYQGEEPTPTWARQKPEIEGRSRTSFTLAPLH